MTVVLGPCPICGHAGADSREGDYDSTIQECGNESCTFACPPAHWDLLVRKTPPPWMAGDKRACDLCGRDGDWHAEGNNNYSQCRGYSPPESP